MIYLFISILIVIVVLIGIYKFKFKINQPEWNHSQRSLSALESWYCAEHATGFAGVFSVFVDFHADDFDRSRFLQAMIRTSLDNPYLRARLVSSSSSSSSSTPSHLHFDPFLSQDAASLIYSRPPHHPGFDQTALDTMRLPFLPHEHLWRCVHLVDPLAPSLHRLVLLFHHLVGDATAGVSIAHHLLLHYAAPPAQQPPGAPSPPRPLTLESLVDIRPTVGFLLRMGVRDWLASRASSRFFSGDTELTRRHLPPAERLCQLASFTVCPERTAAVVAAARHHRVSVNSLLVALIAVAIRSVFRQAVPIKIGVPVSLRREAGITADYPGVFIGKTDVTVPHNDPFFAIVDQTVASHDLLEVNRAWELHPREFQAFAHSIEREIQRGVRNQYPQMIVGTSALLRNQLESYMTKQANRTPSGRDASFKLSNIGKQQFLPQYDALKIHGVYFASLILLHGPPIQFSLVTANEQFHFTLTMMTSLLTPLQTSQFRQLFDVMLAKF